jgi:hypothetical protein
MLSRMFDLLEREASMGFETSPGRYGEEILRI